LSLAKNASSRSNLALLGLTYLFYFGQLGVLVPYLGVFLDGRGFSSVQIGELFALITLARIIGPNLWANMADRSGKGLTILRIGSLLTFLTFSLVFWLDGFWGLSLCFALMMMFWTAVLPQLEVITLNCVDSSAHRYSNIRLWGSIGFIVLTIATGKAIDLSDSDAPIFVSALVLLALFIATLLIREPDLTVSQTTQNGSIWQKIRQPQWLLFILSALLLQVSFGAYYGFFALYMRDLHYDGQTTGILIALGVAAEIVIFILAGRIIQRFGVKWVLIVSIVLTACRWLLLGYYAQWIGILVFAQLLHAFGFGLTHAASVNYIHRFFGSGFQSRGQAIYISVAFGLGGAMGNYFAGLTWQQGLGAQVSFVWCGIVALLSAICLLCIKRSRM
jgi:PPP family 3-phenylpropionic acid transporter